MKFKPFAAMRTCVVCAAMLLGSCETHEVRLAFNTKDSTAQKYLLDSQLKVIVGGDSNAGPMEAMNSRVQARIHSGLVVSYDDGTGRFLLQADSVRYNSDQRSVEECRHIERSLALQDYQYKMGRDGQMKEVTMAGFVPDVEQTDIDLRRLILKIQPVLPGTPVKLGTTWERQHVLAEAGGRQSFVYKWFRVEDIFERDGNTFAKMQMNVKYRMDESDDSLGISQGDDGFVLGSGSVLFNVTSGHIEEGMLEIDGHLKTLQAAPGDSSPNMRVRQIISLRRDS